MTYKLAVNQVLMRPFLIELTSRLKMFAMRYDLGISISDVGQMDNNRTNVILFYIRNFLPQLQKS